MYGTMGSGGRQLSLDDAAGVCVDEALLLLESRLHRPHTHACQVRECTLARLWVCKAQSLGCGNDGCGLFIGPS
jgi:hypothetical protein